MRVLRAIAWHAWGRGTQRTAGDSNLRHNLKETSYTFTGITIAPLTIRVTARLCIATLASYIQECVYTQHGTDLYNFVAFVCPFKLPSQLSGVLGIFVKSPIITMHVH